jgi:hypothetical protein
MTVRIADRQTLDPVWDGSLNLAVLTEQRLLGFPRMEVVGGFHFGLKSLFDAAEAGLKRRV